LALKKSFAGKLRPKLIYKIDHWFMMLFACGIGVGLFFYGVAEPVFHYTGRNRYTADPNLPDNAVAQIAMNLTLYHWGKIPLVNSPYT
jgi:choline-glycine betaine transporter